MQSLFCRFSKGLVLDYGKNTQFSQEAKHIVVVLRTCLRLEVQSIAHADGNQVKQALVLKLDGHK